MYLAELRIKNFRQFGSPDPGFCIRFNKGVTAIVGENDSGKSAIIDAMRHALLTRDMEFSRLQPDDFHIAQDGSQAAEIKICCKLADLTTEEKGSFAEYLSYEGLDVALYIHWIARRLSDAPSSRRWVDISVRSGPTGNGISLDSSVRQLLAAAYLRPLRDAEGELSPGRGSRLSQILAHVPQVSTGEPFSKDAPPADAPQVAALSLVGLADYLRYLVDKHQGVSSAQGTINDEYLKQLALAGDSLHGRITFADAGTEAARLRYILERLELDLVQGPSGTPKGRYGLGSNNLLFMACELLLLGKEPDGLPLLLIEEPEAHLHPQRQLRLMEFLEAAAKPAEDRRSVQVIVTTHSPNLASKIPLANLVLLHKQAPFSLAQGETNLDKGDYRFLERFLDVTKANLFFARAIIIVEGDAEAILIPALARLIGRDLTSYGVSIVNVGGTGLRRYARILQRKDSTRGTIATPVACLADMDVMPDCAPEILGLVESANDPKWTSPKRRWKVLKDFGTDAAEQQNALNQRRSKLRSNDAQNVKTFVADCWTLEYDLAFAGLAGEVFKAAFLAKNDDPLNDAKKERTVVEAEADAAFSALSATHGQNKMVLCSHVYEMFASGAASKAIAAQYLAGLLASKCQDQGFAAGALQAALPAYLLEAIQYVTKPLEPEPAAGVGSSNAE